MQRWFPSPPTFGIAALPGEHPSPSSRFLERPVARNTTFSTYARALNPWRPRAASLPPRTAPAHGISWQDTCRNAAGSAELPTGILHQHHGRQPWFTYPYGRSGHTYRGRRRRRRPATRPWLPPRGYFNPQAVPQRARFSLMSAPAPTLARHARAGGAPCQIHPTITRAHLRAPHPRRH